MKTEAAATTSKGNERDAKMLPEKIAEAAWGKPVDGLRLALVPVRNSAPLNEAVEFQLVVENVSDKDISFTTSDLGQQAVPTLLRADGQAIETRRSQFRAGVRVLPMTLQPGTRTVVARPSVMGVAKAEDGALKYGCAKAIVGALAGNAENEAGLEVHVHYAAKLGPPAAGGKPLTLESGEAKITVGTH